LDDRLLVSLGAPAKVATHRIDRLVSLLALQLACAATVFVA
jgi:hypothetical protein